MDSPLVSIVIVNFNGRKYLKNCFDSLYGGTHKNIEIILVDNGSTDGSLAFIRDNYKDVRIVDNIKNLGLAVASNRGAQIAAGKYLFFYNNDTIADKSLILKLVQRLEADEAIGICGCKTLTYYGRNQINAGVPMDVFGYPYGFGRPFYVDAAIFVRRDVFGEVGGFDEKMFLYGEDRDICWRARLYGYKVVVEPKAFFYHDSACIEAEIKDYRTNIRKRFLGEFNSLRSILKNYSLPMLCFILPLYFFINVSEATIFLLTGKFRVIKEVYVNSYLENIKFIKDTIGWRKKIQKERRVNDLEIMKDMHKFSAKFLLLTKMGIPKVN